MTIGTIMRTARTVAAASRPLFSVGRSLRLHFPCASSYAAAVLPELRIATRGGANGGGIRHISGGSGSVRSGDDGNGNGASSSSSTSTSNVDPSSNSTGGWTPDPNEWVSLRPTYESPDGEKTELRVRVPRPVRRADEPLDARRARLIWTARKRGILESDLLFSTFATRERLAGMSAAGLAQLDSLMEENDWDLYYWVTGARAPPEEVTRMEFWDELVEHAKNRRREILRMPDL